MFLKCSYCAVALVVTFISCFLASDVSCQLTVQINVIYPNAKLNGPLFLRGDGLGLNWNQGEALSQDKDKPDVWTIQLHYSKNDIGSTVQLKALISDQQWMRGSNYMFVVPDFEQKPLDQKQKAPMGTPQFNVYPWFYTESGSIEYIRNVFSPQLNNTRDLVFYVNPSYYENPYKPVDNVLVMHDGQNLFCSSTAFMGNPWHVQFTLDSMIYEGSLEEVFVVGVDNTPDRMNELTYSYDKIFKAGGKGDLYLNFIEETVLPLVKSQYRIPTGRENLAIMGSSLGGLISCYAGWTRPHIYSRAGCVSSTFIWNNNDFSNVVLEKYSDPLPELQIYMDSGTLGAEDNHDDMNYTIAVRDHILSDFSSYYVINQTLYYYLDEGATHNEYYWGARFWISMDFFYTPTPFESRVEEASGRFDVVKIKRDKAVDSTEKMLEKYMSTLRQEQDAQRRAGIVRTGDC